MNAEIDNLEFNKLVNIPTCSSNLKTNVDDIDIYNLRTVPVNLKKLNDVVIKEVFKSAKFNKQIRK